MVEDTSSAISNPQSLRVLVVEDVEDDALLIIRALKKGGYAPEYERVETAAAMRKALQDKTWDIILSDYRMPHFTAVDAIALLKETNIDIPIIIVSGTIGEETAVECMRLGAHDYIMKNNLPRLCQAIARELEEAGSRSKRKQAEEALRQSEEKYRTILENINDGYYEVDLNGNFTFFNDSMCRILGYPQEEMTGMNNRQFTDIENAKKLFKTFSEVYRTGESAKEFGWQIIRKDGTKRYIEVSVSLQKNSSGKTMGFRGIARDITERKRAEEEQKQSLEQMRKALRATVHSISLTVEMKDPYTSGHQQRVADLALAIAAEMGLSADRQDFIRTASTIHDIGKIAIPTEILSKPTKLINLEFNLIKTHSRSGYDILKDIEFPWPVADVVLQHHERMDGSGYPQGLKGNDILLEARILAIADVVEAIASHRPYRPALGIDIALEEISRNKGIFYDADAVDACLKLFREKGYSLVSKA
jgi:PAS domain S-box-containing protein/putative nucleotidyltransferase with HDIG domain